MTYTPFARKRIHNNKIMTTQEKLYGNLANIRRAAQALPTQFKSVHAQLNEGGFEGLRDTMEVADTMGGWLTLLSTVNGVNSNQNKMLLELENDLPRAATIMRAIEAALSGDGGAEASTLLQPDKGFALGTISDLQNIYEPMKATGDYIPIEASAYLTTNEDGTVSVSAMPAPVPET